MKYRCPAAGCAEVTPRRFSFCTTHWLALPAWLHESIIERHAREAGGPLHNLAIAEGVDILARRDKLYDADAPLAAATDAQAWRDRGLRLIETTGEKTELAEQLARDGHELVWQTLSDGRRAIRRQTKAGRFIMWARTTLAAQALAVEGPPIRTYVTPPIGRPDPALQPSLFGDQKGGKR